MIKRHWPILVALLLIIISIILGILASNATDSGDVIFLAAIIFMFLLPLAGAVNGGWYGWKLRSPLKWLLAPAVYLCICLFFIASDLISGASGDMGAFWSIGLFTGIACLAAEAIASLIAWLVRRNK